ncbi:MAG: hypothetical protein WBZ36_18340, partial [Candidatus Nitrosopolaris sp.]
LSIVVAKYFVKNLCLSISFEDHHYPDIVKEINNSLKVKEAIIEGEVVAINPQTSEFLPFQELMQHKVQEAMEGYLLS